MADTGFGNIIWATLFHQTTHQAIETKSTKLLANQGMLLVHQLSPVG